MKRAVEAGACYCRLRRTSSTTATSSPSLLKIMEPPPSDSERYCYEPVLCWDPQVEQYFHKAYGPEHFARISKALTRPSSYSCIRVNPLRSTTDVVIQKLFSILNERPIGEVDSTATVGDAKQASCVQESFPNSSLDKAGDGEFSVHKLQSSFIYKCQIPALDYVVFVRGSGPHTIQYGDGAGQPIKEIIVSRKCAEAVLRGAQVYVPGVLACSAHVEKGDKVAVSVAVEQLGSDNKWSVGITRGTILHGLQTDPRYVERKCLYIGQGTAMMSRAAMFRVAEGVAVELTDRVYQLSSFHNVLEGDIFLQNLPSIVAAHVLDPQEGEHILDMCAAPGGKTTAIAILMRDKGKIIAIDRSHNKVMDIYNLASEMGLTCISAYRLDALKAICSANDIVDISAMDLNQRNLCGKNKDSKIGGLGNEMHGSAENCIVPSIFHKSMQKSKPNQGYRINYGGNMKNIRLVRNGRGKSNCTGIRVEKLKGFLPNTFDRVLLDAPCSALGLRPRLFAGEETLVSLENHAKYQKQMLDQAVKLVRPGGVIVYSTCTINPGENEALVRYALDTYQYLSLAPQHPKIGGPGLVGHCELFNGRGTEKWLTPIESEMVQRFDPTSSLDTIGFFIAKFNVGKKEM